MQLTYYFLFIFINTDLHLVAFGIAGLIKSRHFMITCRYLLLLNISQVVGGGRCLVFWRPETPTPHRVDIKFNGEPVPSSPFVFHVAPAQRVTIDTTQVGKSLYIHLRLRSSK